ncbi:MAG: CHAT domain-containing protein, partial [bacterium]
DRGDTRWGVFAPTDELFEDAIALAIDHGDTNGALAYCERGRARELIEAIEDSGRSPMADASKGDAIIIEFASLPARLIIFVVDHGRVRAVQQQVARPDLQESVEQLGRSVMANDEPQFRRYSAAIYERLLAPIVAGLPADRTLVFIPDGTLRAVPFAALIDSAGHYLIEQHAVVIAPSAAVFTRLATAHPSPLQGRLHLLLVIGMTGGLDPLSAANREANDVAAVYGSQVKIVRQDIQPSALEARAASAEILHFVGHEIEANGVREAALVTAGRRDGRVGYLTVHDIASMSLRHTRAVVLAACGTARGRERVGEGSISVAHAFLRSGVPSVVATLWPIDDAAAADFFTRLHRHLAAGVSPVEALRAAQLECIRRRDVPLTMWSAVQVLGS